MINVKAIILDMDGTMFDTQKLYFDVIKQIFSLYKVTVTEDELKTLVGVTMREVEEFIKARIDNAYFDEFCSKFFEYYKNYIIKFGTPLKFGLLNLIDYAKVCDIKLAIATSSEKDDLYFKLQHSGIEVNKFDVILCKDDVKNPKPDSEIYIKACNELGLDAVDCLVVEDSYLGATAGKGAGCNVAMVKDMQESNAELDNQIIDFKFYNLNEIISFLKFNKIDCTATTIYEKDDDEFYKKLCRCKKRIRKFNKIKFTKLNKQRKKMTKIFGKIGENCTITSPFYCDIGEHIEIGNNFFANHGVCMLDTGKIVIGNNCRFGPYSGVYNVGHAYEPKARIAGGVYCKTVYI
ncbi:MAG: HAD-IA family hydrolase, partial [Clostridia bacterium]|nr:HAD-IA family hydrolase [Clostridia bacterium]